MPPHLTLALCTFFLEGGGEVILRRRGDSIHLWAQMASSKPAQGPNSLCEMLPTIIPLMREIREDILTNNEREVADRICAVDKDLGDRLANMLQVLVEMRSL